MLLHTLFVVYPLCETVLAGSEEQSALLATLDIGDASTAAVMGSLRRLVENPLSMKQDESRTCADQGLNNQQAG